MAWMADDLFGRAVSRLRLCEARGPCGRDSICRLGLVSGLSLGSGSSLLGVSRDLLGCLLVHEIPEFAPL